MLLYGKKRRHIRYLLATARPRIFAPHFFIIEDFSLLEKSRDEKKVAAAEQGNFYWERRLGLFWKLCKESITKLLVSLVHQFIWPSFTLVFTRNGIFRYSQKPWIRLTFRTEAGVQECSVKKMFLEISQNSQKNTCARVSFSIKFQAWDLRPETGTLLWVLWNFEEPLFSQSTYGGCWTLSMTSIFIMSNIASSFQSHI